MDDNRFGVFIKAKRNELELSIRQASRLIGISHTYLSILEKGIDPRNGSKLKANPTVIKQISEGYEVDYNYLLSLVGYIDSTNNLEIKEESSADIEFALNKVISDLDKKGNLFINSTSVKKEDWIFIKDSINVFLSGLKVRINETSAEESQATNELPLIITIPNDHIIK